MCSFITVLFNRYKVYQCLSEVVESTPMYCELYCAAWLNNNRERKTHLAIDC